jgi:hypothetical protein
MGLGGAELAMVLLWILIIVTIVWIVRRWVRR